MTWILTFLLFDLPDLDFDLVHAGAQGHGGYPDGLLDSWFVVLCLRGSCQLLDHIQLNRSCHYHHEKQK